MVIFEQSECIGLLDEDWDLGASLYVHTDGGKCMTMNLQKGVLI